MNNDNFKKNLFVRLPLIIHWITILILTSLPSDSLPTVGLSDKWQHFLAYFVLSFFLFYNLEIQKKYLHLRNYALISTIIICSVYGAVDEIHQLFIPGRAAEFIDWIANFLGTLAGSFLALYFLNRFKNFIYSFLRIKLEPLSE